MMQHGRPLFAAQKQLFPLRIIVENNRVVRTFSNVSFDDSVPRYEVVIVGGGIVGAATAREILLRHPKLRSAILEKEDRLAKHQSGHNSGVIHAGIYYKPGTLKAKLCVEGMQLVYQYCEENGIPYKKVGKLIVATDKIELDRLKDLHDRALKNGVPDLRVVDENGIREIEPHCKGLMALHSPHTGIVDFALVTEYYGKDFQKGGGDIHLNFEVSNFREANDPSYPVVVSSTSGKRVLCKYVLTCGGLHSDRLAEMTGCPSSPRIVPFRGEYLLLRREKCHLIKGNIYPVPDPRFPFLGVHFTPRMDGSVWLGPNAVLAFKREGYSWRDVNVSELLSSITYGGFLKMALRYFRYGGMEMLKSAFPGLQVNDLRKYVPDVTKRDVSRGPAGVRAQALDLQGNLVDDFYFDRGEGPVGSRVLHCRNAPSPGATSSLAIAKMMTEKVEKEFEIP